MARSLTPDSADDLARQAQKSLADQVALEASDTRSFDAYLQCYFAQT
jgi:hypothetical protein